MQQGRRSHAGNRAAPTHAWGVLCMYVHGQKPAVGPVMNITQEDPTLVQGPAFPRKSYLEWELSTWVSSSAAFLVCPVSQSTGGDLFVLTPQLLHPVWVQPCAQLHAAKQGSLNANFISEPLALFQEPAASEPFLVLHM